MTAFFVSCQSGETTQIDRGVVVTDSAIAFHGGDIYDRLNTSFRFRERGYQIIRQSGKYDYYSMYRDSTGNHLRHLSNSGYTQTLNGVELKLNAKDSVARSASVNSVVYFALLPGLLDSPAAKKEFLGDEVIDDKSYIKVKVTFDQEGGGEDFEDVFLYWFSKENYAMDYLAYSYLEEEGGTRFRKAINRRRVNGLVYQDYINFKGPSPDSLMFISDLFKAEKLDTLSLIELRNLRVETVGGN